MATCALTPADTCFPLLVVPPACCCVCTGYCKAPKRHDDRCRVVQVASVPATCADAFKAVGVSEVAKPQQVPQYISTFGSDLTICAVARCPQGGYLAGSSISSWPEANVACGDLHRC